MSSKPKKGVPFSSIHESCKYGMSPQNLSIVELNTIAEKLKTATGSRICFRKDYKPTNWKKAVRDCIKRREVTFYESGRRMPTFYTRRSRIDAYRIANYYFPEVTLRQVYGYVDTLRSRGAVTYINYCGMAKRHMFV